MTASPAEICAPYPLPGLVPTARQMIAPVVEQVKLARDTYRLRLEAPELARRVVPGQFFMIRAPGITNPLLGRPFALFDTWLDSRGNPAGIDVVYLVVGKMTALMSAWTPGDCAEVWGPLGNGFPLPSGLLKKGTGTSQASGHPGGSDVSLGASPLFQQPAGVEKLVIAAGGIGNTPFPAVVREATGLRRYGDRSVGAPLAPGDITYCYGVRSAEYLAAVEDFAALGIAAQVATDDGSRGHKGFVTDLVAAALDEADGRRAGVYCCGPEPMMHAVARLAEQKRVPCWLSLETPMACGFGACFSCVTRVKQDDGGWDYRRTCVEGPIFRAEQLEL